MAPQDYVNLKIDVEGKVYDVKVEKGISFNDIAVQNNGSIFKLEETIKFTKDSVYEKTSLDNNTVKMTKEEFSLFQAVANNESEVGDSIVLSIDDLYSARRMYHQDSLAEDISKDLPEGYKANANMPYKNKKYLEVGAEAAGKKHKMIFEIAEDDNMLKFNSHKEAFLHGGPDSNYIELHGGKNYDGSVDYSYEDIKNEKFYKFENYKDEKGREITKKSSHSPGRSGDSVHELRVKDKDGTIHIRRDGLEESKYSPKRAKKTGISYERKSISNGQVEERIYEADYAKKTGISCETYYSNGKLESRDYEADYAKKTGISCETYYSNGKLESRDYEADYAKKTGISRETYFRDGKVQGRWYEAEQAKKTGISSESSGHSPEKFGYDSHFPASLYNPKPRILSREKGWESELIINYISRRSDNIERFYAERVYETEHAEKTGIKAEWYDEQGRVAKRTCIDGSDYFYYYLNEEEKAHLPEAGEYIFTSSDGVLVFNDKNELIRCKGYDVSSYFDETKLSEEAKKYRTEFKNLSAKEIAKKMSEQIEGYSSNDKTLAMFDAVPIDKLLKVMEGYSLLETKPLLSTMSDEWFMDLETDIMPRTIKVITAFVMEKGGVIDEYPYSGRELDFGIDEDKAIKYLKQLEAIATGRPPNFFLKM